MPTQLPRKKRIAIVGTGVSGLATLYSLRKRCEADCDIFLFERDTRLGGHTNTQEWMSPDKSESVPVDTGFIVINSATYPNFLNFLDHLGINTNPTEMTFSVSRDFGEYEWSGDAPFCQWHNLFSPSHWRMLFDYTRFNAFATDILRETDCDKNKMTMGEYLNLHNYSRAFRDNYLLPMTACVWSTGPEKCALDFPAVTLIRFLSNHNLLNTITKRPKWLTIPQGSVRYIYALMHLVPSAQIDTKTRVISVTTGKDTGDGKVIMRLANNEHLAFDDVVLACHGDQALQLRGQNATELEKNILSAFKTTSSLAYLHSDTSLLPVRKAAWSSWNYLTSSDNASLANQYASTVSLTYNMNILQNLSTKKYGNILVSLNPPKPPSQDKVQQVIKYRHPIYTNAAVSSQRRLEPIQGRRGIWYAGAWTGYGFHEDGFTSGLWVGQALGGDIPFTFMDYRTKKSIPETTGGQHIGRVLIMLVNLLIQFWSVVFAALDVRSPVLSAARQKLYMKRLGVQFSPEVDAALAKKKKA